MKFTNNESVMLRVGRFWIEPHETVLDPILTQKEYRAFKKLSKSGKITIEDTGIGPQGPDDEIYDSMTSMVFISPTE